MKKIDPRSRSKASPDAPGGRDPRDTFIVNDQPTHVYTSLKLMPETQLLMLLPPAAWMRLAQYIPAVEAAELAGRFGASPGEYEWEWIAKPQSLRWWRRGVNGFEHLWGMAAGVPVKEGVELYGLVEIDETSPFWSEAIPDEVGLAMPMQARLIAREGHRSEEDLLAELYRNYFAKCGQLTQMQPGGPACRKGTVQEVEIFRDAIKGLLKRAAVPLRPDALKP